jgi:hypothetical protein
MGRSSHGLDFRKADPRHGVVKGLLDGYWALECPSIPSLPWGAADAGALGQFLRANPELATEIVAGCLQHRLLSEDHAPGERVHRWIGDLLRYAGGPLNRFKQPLRASPLSLEASLGTYRPGKPVAAPEPRKSIRSQMGERWFDKMWKRSERGMVLSDLERDCLREEGLL